MKMSQNEREKEGKKGQHHCTVLEEDPQAVALAAARRRERYSSARCPCRREIHKLHHFDLKQGEAGEQQRGKHSSRPGH